MYKFREDDLIREFKNYVDSTYNQHYATDKYQATDIIIDSGHGTGFCLGNVIKYAKRYGNKGTSDDARQDIMKVLHYALIQLHVHDTKFGTLTDYPEYDPDLVSDVSNRNSINDATPEEWNNASRNAYQRSLSF